MDKEKKNFIFKKLFLYIQEIKKLEVIRYNRYIQNMLNIGLINYKIKSGKYKIGEKNGNGKEYNFKNKLIFEGEYLNGKRNGKGKEYNSNDELIFEGEYKNGIKLSGKGYDSKGNILYEMINE